jgi:hypothetical protein
MVPVGGGGWRAALGEDAEGVAFSANWQPAQANVNSKRMTSQCRIEQIEWEVMDFKPTQLYDFARGPANSRLPRQCPLNVPIMSPTTSAGIA